MKLNWMIIINIVFWLLGKLKDTDGDGTPDVFDKEPVDPNKK